ncbi:MAG TPA: hypothetical protein VGI79_21815 [Caulobacteraceae bacterium]|jgi:hypothetical protein
MKRLLAASAVGCFAVAVAVALSQSALAQEPPSESPEPGPATASKPLPTDWGSPDGGSVVIKPNRAYTMILDDASAHNSIFSEGHVLSSQPTPEGGRIYHLKPTTPGQATTTFEVIVKPDGKAELWMTKAGARHLAAPLKP